MITLDFRGGQGPLEIGPGGFPIVYLSGVTSLPVRINIVEYASLDAQYRPISSGRTIEHTQRQIDRGGGLASVAFDSLSPYDPVNYGYQFTFTDADDSLIQISIGNAGAPGGGGGQPPTPQDPAHGWGDPNDLGPDPAEWMAASGETDRLRLFIDELDITDYCTNLDGFLKGATRTDKDVDLPGVSAEVRVLTPPTGGSATLGLTVTNGLPTDDELAASLLWAVASPIQRLARRQQMIEQVLARPTVLLKVVRWPGEDPFGNPGTRVAEAVCIGGRDWKPINKVIGIAHTVSPQFKLTKNSWREEQEVIVDIPAGADHVRAAEFTRGTAPVEDLDISFVGGGTLTDHATGVTLTSVAGALIHCDPNLVTLDNGATMKNTTWQGSGTPFLLTPGGRVSSTGQVRLYGYVRYASGF